MNAPAAFATGKPKTPKASESPSASASPSPMTTPTVSQWLAPKPSTQAINVKAGSTIPLRFRVVNAGNEIKDVTAVAVTLTPAACLGTGAAGPSPIPAPIKPGKSTMGKSAVFRYNGSQFQYSWKIDKDAKPGCYQFKVIKAVSGVAAVPEVIYLGTTATPVIRVR